MSIIEFSPIALNDLQDIDEYILENWGEDTRLRILSKIISDIKQLEEFPLLGMDLGKKIYSTTDYRYIISENNYIFYRIEVDKIRIIRVLNERQNFIEILFRNSADNEG